MSKLNHSPRQMCKNGLARRIKHVIVRRLAKCVPRWIIFILTVSRHEHLDAFTLFTSKTYILMLSASNICIKKRACQKWLTLSPILEFVFAFRAVWSGVARFEWKSPSKWHQPAVGHTYKQTHKKTVCLHVNWQQKETTLNSAANQTGSRASSILLDAVDHLANIYLING